MAEEARCRCGRAKAEAAYRVFHETELRHTYFLCVCGQEWTETVKMHDPHEPVTSEEIIDLHERMKRHGTLEELLG